MRISDIKAAQRAADRENRAEEVARRRIYNKRLNILAAASICVIAAYEAIRVAGLLDGF